ncbi:MAG: glutathione S-transferase family protein [Proteobacteria bacterium]|nr:glutathione S-transferase family protein [Pseudomonadota bacterium]
MKLYDLKAGTNPRRVRIFLAEKGLTIPRVEVDMPGGENRREPYLTINPMGTMPVLELDDGTHIAESIAICRYFEEMHPNPPLFGATPVERGLVEMWNRRMEFEISRPVQEAFVHLSPYWVGKREQIPEAGTFARKTALARMAWLDGELATRPFIAGERYTVADITAQCGLLLGKNTGTPIPEELKNLGRWFAEVTSRPTARA